MLQLSNFMILGALKVFDDVESVSTIKKNHSNTLKLRFLETFLTKFK